MRGLLLLLAVAAQAPLPPQAREALLRRRVAEVALLQLRAPDPRWERSQRDCAGLVRFAFRSAHRLLEPSRAAPLFRDEQGRPSEFADARTLLASTFAPLGRGPEALRALRSGDLLAFRQQGSAQEPEHHLMLVVLPPDGALSGALVVYHPGQQGASVRSGALLALQREAPLEWRPVPENSAFLGFYRFKEWLK